MQVKAEAIVYCLHCGALFASSCGDICPWCGKNQQAISRNIPGHDLSWRVAHAPSALDKLADKDTMRTPRNGAKLMTFPEAQRGSYGIPERDMPEWAKLMLGIVFIGAVAFAAIWLVLNVGP